MKTYYVMINFGGPYVTGFVSQGNDPWHAVRTLKRALWVRLRLNKDNEQLKQFPGDDFHPNRIREYLRSLKRPWRRPGNPRHTTKGEWVEFRDEKPIVNIIELQLPVIAGFWLQDIIQGKELCNTVQGREGTKALRLR